ncbi:unnamed protein product [Rodentolepis nana]|uniref:E3 ubiquitin-protein ligase n=1 Tax=Rodentolepis nana TaxID=102285 RepID=A0A0R3TB32_RODNA|nr:unnamed protein product [Rodentolepis nana]
MENKIKESDMPNDYVLGEPFIKWLSARGRKERTDCINAINTGFLRCLSLLPNSPMFWMRDYLSLPIDPNSSEQCFLCKNMPQEKKTYDNINEDVLSGRVLGARFVIDLHLFIMPTAYTGSNDGEKWLTLKVHRNDQSLDSRNEVKFELDISEFALLSIDKCLRGFRLLRIVDLSPIASQGRLHVCGLDFFGSVLYFHDKNFRPTILPNWDSKRIFRPHLSASPTLTEVHLLNLALAVRKDDRLEWAMSNFTDSTWEIGQDEEAFYCYKIEPEATNLKDFLKPLYDSASLWKFRFHLNAVHASNGIIASIEMPRLKNPLFTSLLKLAQKVADLKFADYRSIQIAIEITSSDEQQFNDHSFYPKQVNPEANALLSERDWYLAKEQINRLNEETAEFNELNATKEIAEEILQLIRLLYHMHESRDTNSQKWNSFTDFHSCFISQGLSRKLTRQLDDALASVTGPTFPDWCFKLPHNMPYLFPFELRRRLFNIGAFGPARSNNFIMKNSVHRYSFVPKWELDPRLDKPVTELLSYLHISQEETAEIKSESLKRVRIVSLCTAVSRNAIENDEGKRFWLYADEVLHEQAPENKDFIYFYKDEVGGGSGVTRDFFSLLSKELLRKHHHLWMNDRENVSGEFVDPSFGLFPTPYPRSAVPLTVIQRFYSMGIAVAKALQEKHLISLNLSRPFIKILSSFARARCLSGDGSAIYDKLNCIEQWRSKALLSDDISVLHFGNQSRNISSHWLTELLDFNDFAELYPHHASLFRKFMELHKAHEVIRQNFSKTEGGASLEDQLNEASLQLIGSTIPDLCLSMAFYSSSNVSMVMAYSCPSIEWISNRLFVFSSKLVYKNVSLQDVYPWEEGKFDPTMIETASNTDIDNDNYMDYVRRTMEYCLDKGIRAQIDAFICKPKKLYYFLLVLSEVRDIICGQSTVAPWSEAELTAYIKSNCSQGKSSPTFKNFVKVLAGLNAVQRGQFLRWSTGYSNLPIGGLKNLNPPIMICPSNKNQGPYPLVQACVHEISLPEYSSASAMRPYLLEAISHESFEMN